jgi:XTP/dITP diphosphohydrolase
VPRLLIATRSVGKLRELQPLFAAYGIDAIDLAAAGVDESREEDGLEIAETFEENALAKARYFHALTAYPTVADDSGLAVDALAGRPGVMSKRWSGRTDLSGQALDDENNRLLLRRLREIEEREAEQAQLLVSSRAGSGSATHRPGRHARYICAAAYVDSDRELVRRGEVSGRIVDDARGLAGFGYDPFFLSDELGQTFGEAGGEEKERVSHRGRAFRALLMALNASAIGG